MSGLPDPGPADLRYELASDAARLARTTAALVARGFDAMVAVDIDDARRLVMELVPEGAEVHSALSETLREIGVTQIIDDSGRYDSIRKRLLAMDRATQGREMRKLAAAPDFVIGSVHAITDDGILLVGSGSGSQIGPYAYAAGKVILVAGHQKLVRDLEEGRRRLMGYSLPREHLRMQSVGRAGSLVAKTLTIEREFAGRTRVILVPAMLGF
jgi:hypothetical protein